jgi:hypothetical protein
VEQDDVKNIVKILTLQYKDILPNWAEILTGGFLCIAELAMGKSAATVMLKNECFQIQFPTTARSVEAIWKYGHPHTRPTIKAIKNCFTP